MTMRWTPSRWRGPMATATCSAGCRTSLHCLDGVPRQRWTAAGRARRGAGGAAAGCRRRAAAGRSSSRSRRVRCDINLEDPAARSEPAKIAAAFSEAEQHGTGRTRRGRRGVLRRGRHEGGARRTSTRARKMNRRPPLFFCDYASKSQPVKLDPTVIIAPRVDGISFTVHPGTVFDPPSPLGVATARLDAIVRRQPRRHGVFSSAP